MQTPTRRRTSTFLAVSVAVLVVVGSLGYLRASSRPRARKVVLVTIDALRADRLGCYGYTRPTSPVIDALAGQSILFEKAMVQAPWTGPSMGSLMTGRYPAEIGMYRNRDGISQKFPMLAEHFQRAGFHTASFMANSLLLGKGNAFVRGFDESSAPQPTKISYVDLEPRILTWLEQHAREDFFVWIHSMDTHPPATVGNPYRQQQSKEFPGYDGEVKWVDEAMGRLIDKLQGLGIWDETLFILTADHGEAFGEHGMSGHQNVIYDEVLHVPLIVRYPGMKRSARISEPVELLDLFATMAEIAGLQRADRGRSESLVPILEGRSERRQKSYLFHSRYYLNNTHHLAVRDRQWKLIAKVDAALDSAAKPAFPSWRLDGEGSRFELYRVDEDPREKKDRIAEPEAAAVVERLKDALLAWQQVALLSQDGTRELKDLDSGTLELLRNLGYVE